MIAWQNMSPASARNLMVNMSETEIDEIMESALKVNRTRDREIYVDSYEQAVAIYRWGQMFISMYNAGFRRYEKDKS